MLTSNLYQRFILIFFFEIKVKLGQDWFQINTGCWIKWSN
jgi:hypothetical protein